MPRGLNTCGMYTCSVSIELSSNVVVRANIWRVDLVEVDSEHFLACQVHGETVFGQ